MDIFKDDHMGRLRADRNLTLKETDWWAGSDLTMTSEQTIYRQALRNLPITSPNPIINSDGQLTGVIWPTKPE
tara:strand:- start:759 stop:977 length:219 start_codon:yes stop_codon:yes gene_type:complete